MIRVVSKQLGAVILSLAAFCVPVLSQTGTFTEWAVPTTGSEPLHLVAGSGSIFYFTESARNTVAQLNTTTNTFVEFKLPEASMPHGVVLSGSTLMFCAFSGNYIGFLNLKTGALTGWPIPTPAAGNIHLDVSGTSVFFTEVNGNKVGLLNSANSQISEWLIPTAGALPRGVVIGPGTQVFVAELGVSKIAMLDYSANTITEWTLPSVFKTVEHLRFANGLVYFGDLNSSWLATLDPVANILTSWESPSPNAAIPDLFVSGQLINLSERKANKIALLNPTVQQGTTQTLPPLVTPVTPVVTAVQSELLHGAKLTSTKVTPKVNSVAGVVTGGFTEWAIPTTSSEPLGIIQVGSTVAFTEYSGNKIGTLILNHAIAMAKP